MTKHIEFLEVQDITNDKVTMSKPFLIKLDQIETLSQSRYKGCCEVKIDGRKTVVQGEYKDLKAKIDYIRESAPARLCYVFQASGVGCTYSHYVPVDTIGSIMVDKGNNVVTLVLKTGDKLCTYLNMQDLKKTLIEVNF